MRLLSILLSGVLSLWVPAWLESGAALPNSPAPRRAAAVVAPLPVPNPQDVSIFEEKVQIASGESALPARTLAVARSFLGVPYVSGTLNQNSGREQLILNLRELDCWTFVENSMAIALTAGSSGPAFDTLQQFVRQLRYWGGTVDGFASRNHYFSGWLLQAEKLGYLHDLTRAFGGIPYRKTIGYMTAHPQQYPPLCQSEVCRQMKAVEQRLNQHNWYFIPQNRVAKIEHLLRDGDIIALTSGKKGLDIAHQGFAVRKNGHIYLLHASSLHKRVILSAQPLAQYLLGQKGQTGIMVARID